MDIHKLLLNRPLELGLFAILQFGTFLLFVREVKDSGITKRQRYTCTAVILILHVIGQCLRPGFFSDWIIKTALDSCYLYYTRRLKAGKCIYISSIFFLITDIGKLFAMEVVMERIPAEILTRGNAVFWTNLHTVLVLLPALVISNQVRRLVINDNNAAYEVPAHLRALSLLTIIPYCFVRTIQFHVNDGESFSSDDVLVVALVLVICIIIQMITSDNVYSMNVKRIEGINQELMNRQQEQYKKEMELMEGMNQRLHDMKHYINALDSLQTMEEVRQYAAGLRDKLMPLQTCHESGNALVDVILTQKIQYCYQNNIQIMPYVDAKETDFIQNLDLCTIMGNTIDNAIEAAIQMEDEAKREIDVRMSKINSMIVYQVSNYFQGPLREKNGHLLTTKADEYSHGYGLLNVKSALEKYDGTMNYKYQEDEFTINIVIPIP